MGGFREVVFDTKQVVLTAEGGLDGWRLVSSDRGWAPFADAVTAFARTGRTTPPDGVTATPGDQHASAALRGYWQDQLGWKAGQPPLRFFAYTAPGNEGALMPEEALASFAARAAEPFEEWKREAQRALAQQAARRAAFERVQAEPRTVDWDAPDAAVLTALEARVRSFDDLRPDEPVTHVLREGVLLAVAAAGVLDGPDDGRRERHLAGLGLKRLGDWRGWALELHDLAGDVPEVLDPDAPHVLASPVGLDWLRLGPYAGKLVGPTDWLAWHLRSFGEELRTAPSFHLSFTRGYEGRVVWRTGVAGLQQLCAAGDRAASVPWEGQATTLAAKCTRGQWPALGAMLAAALASARPADWHGWAELGAALVSTCMSGAPRSLATTKGALDRYGLAGAGRACMKKAVAMHPALKGASWIANLEGQLEDDRIFHDTSPVPLDELPKQLLAHTPRAALAPHLAALKGGLRRDLERLMAASPEVAAALR